MTILMKRLLPGCATCKLKRLKCGEEKPACTNCIKRGVQCGGYKKTFQWRDYGNAQVKTNVSNQKQGEWRNHCQVHILTLPVRVAWHVLTSLVP